MLLYNLIQIHGGLACLGGKTSNVAEELYVNYNARCQRSKAKNFSLVAHEKEVMHIDWQRESGCTGRQPGAQGHMDVGFSFTSLWRATFMQQFGRTTSSESFSRILLIQFVPLEIYFWEGFSILVGFIVLPTPCGARRREIPAPSCVCSSWEVPISGLQFWQAVTEVQLRCRLAKGTDLAHQGHHWLFAIFWFSSWFLMLSSCFGPSLAAPIKPRNNCCPIAVSVKAGG